MEQNTDQPVPPAFWDYILDRVDPHQAFDAETAAVRIVCGRWLAFRRLQAGVPLSQFAERVGMPAETLVLIEAGAGRAGSLTREVRRQLARALADEAHDPAWVAVVCDLALGENVAAAARYIQAVRAEVMAYQTPNANEMLNEILAGAAHTAHTSQERVILREEPPLIEILSFLIINDNANVHVIWNWCRGRFRRNQFSDALDTLLTLGWVSTNAHGSEGRFSVTGSGRRELQIALRELDAARSWRFGPELRRLLPRVTQLLMSP